MIRLIDADLGALELRCDPFVVVSFQISAPAVRAVMRNRALADGAFDDTRFVGARAVTIALRLKGGLRCSTMTTQQLLDLLLPFTHPRRRPTLEWSLPGSDSVIRKLTVRGEGAPIEVASPRAPVVVASFVAGDGTITSARGGEDDDGWQCRLIDPSGDVEAGRVYDLEFDRVYPESSGIGDRIITMAGNEDAHWRATIFGPTTDPYLRINGVEISFTEQGGLTLVAGESVVIDTRERTILLNGEATESRYDRTNFYEWSWSDLLLKPGENRIRFGADVLGVGSSVNFCWADTWLA